MKNEPTFYVEGIIASIELEVSGSKMKQFSLVPASEFLVALPDGKKKVLFVYCSENDREMNTACLVKTDKNENDKDVIFFKAQDPWPSVLLNMLIQAKSNRSKVRVCTRRRKNSQNNAIPYPNLEDVFEIHLI